MKNEQSARVLERYQESCDDSAKNADALLAELQAEAERE